MKTIVAKHRDRFKGWLDRLLEEHGAKVLVILIGLLIVLPGAVTWRYLTTTANVANEAREAAEQAKTATKIVHRLTLENAALVTSLQAALVESCRTIGNQRAIVQREELTEEIYEAQHPDPGAFRALVEAGVPPEAIEEAEAKQIVKLRERLSRVHLAHCVSQYRISPGSGVRRRARR